MAQRKRRKQNTPLDNAVSIVTAAALVIIAVLLVVFVALYIKNNTGLSKLFPDEETPGTEAPEETDETPDETEELRYGLLTLSDGSIVYAMTRSEASSYDSEYTKSAYEADKAYYEAAGISRGTESSPSSDRYYLVNSWLDYNYGLYHFDEYGRAARDEEYSERAFVYSFDGEGRAKSIVYNSHYTENPESGYESYPGILRTRALWVYMDEDNVLGSYTALMYKKSTESSPSPLGAASARQYASPYAYEIVDRDIYYLAVAGIGLKNALTENIEGRVFRMSGGGDTRYVSASDSVGFKVLKDSYGDPVVYSYDGEKLTRSQTFEEDETIVVFSEDLSYEVSFDGSHAYLELAGGQRVTMESASFKAGNFTYSLAADGEILSVADKTTVNTGGYTYYIQHGTSFGAQKSRVLRRSSDGVTEVISSEFDGTTANLHYDYDSSSMIAEYTDAAGRGGLLKISLDGDVDLLGDSLAESGVTLYAIQNSTAVLRRVENGEAIFYTARIDASSPLAVAVDPEALGDETEETTSAEIAETPAAAETSAAPEETASVGNGPGGGDTGYDGIIYNGVDTEISVGPGG